MLNTKIHTVWGLALIMVSSCNQSPSKYRADFNFDVNPILSDKCFACHGPDENSRKSELRLDTKEGIFRALKEDDGFVVVPGSSSKSKMYERIISDDPEQVMPPPDFNVTLTDEEKVIIKNWIDEGANWKKHWAYNKPENTLDQDKEGNPIDQFVAEKLEQYGKEFKEKTDKETLIRRLSFDLRGLPPSVEEIDNYLSDDGDDATSKLINSFIASSAYGEKMATEWMDVSRFADTHGYTVDRYRPMWKWRDWVIKSYNENMPFDEFIKWQIAGDLIPNATREQILATGFNRNHSQNMEGGIISEEYRSEYVADRTITLGRAFLGMTMECARCHDHKYDPISQKNFYQLYSFFNNVDESGQISWNNATPVPTLLLYKDEEQRKVDSLKVLIAEAENTLKKLEDIDGAVRAGYSSYDPQKIAHYSFDNSLINRIAKDTPATVENPIFAKGKMGSSVLLNGDDIMKFGEIGQFSKSDPFTIGLWVYVPKDLDKGVIFHKGDGAILHNFRGYHLGIENGKFDIVMAHTFPYNSVHEVSLSKVVREEWIHLALTHDGSGTAEGIKLFVNGSEEGTTVIRDNLYKDILFFGKNTITGSEPGLKVGARVRGKGFKNGKVDELQIYKTALPSYSIERLAGRTYGKTPEKDKEFYLKTSSSEWKNVNNKLFELRSALTTLVEGVEEIMVMDEMAKPRSTYILKRGEYNNYGEQVQPGTPEEILPFPNNLPQNRLGLSEWLTDEDNPLVARVTMNRLWQQFFGRGLLTTIEDFGNQGDLPSHPKLLDWLAVEFINSGWDLKHMVSLIVSSETYQQSSIVDEKEIKWDPDNKWLSRGPSWRLSAEMIRDNVLAASGLLVREIGGPSAKPYQPEGLWRVNNSRYVKDSLDNLYKRSLYTFWKRTVPPPAMNTFDAPTRAYCTVKRQKTSTPMQALNLMNDPQFIEAGTELAKIAVSKFEEDDKRIQYIFRSLTSRKANQTEMGILNTMINEYKKEAIENPDKFEGFLKSGDLKFESDTNLLAYSVLASAVINLDATIMRR